MKLLTQKQLLALAYVNKETQAKPSLWILRRLEKMRLLFWRTPYNKFHPNACDGWQLTDKGKEILREGRHGTSLAQNLQRPT